MFNHLNQNIKKILKMNSACSPITKYLIRKLNTNIINRSQTILNRSKLLHNLRNLLPLIIPFVFKLIVLSKK